MDVHFSHQLYSVPPSFANPTQSLKKLPFFIAPYSISKLNYKEDFVMIKTTNVEGLYDVPICFGAKGVCLGTLNVSSKCLFNCVNFVYSGKASSSCLNQLWPGWYV